MSDYYDPRDFGGKKEEELRRIFFLQRDDAKNYFVNVIKPRLDRAYKLYIAYTGDRAQEVQSWQANIFVPYVQAVVETLMPRILDARPEFAVVGRSSDDQLKAEKQVQLGDYFWELARMDRTNEDLCRAAMIYGTGYLQVSWKKDVRELKFLKSKDLARKKYEWKKETRVFYDAPFAEWVDNYALWYDWHNVDRKSKQYWFKRLVLTEEEIRRRYPMLDEKRLQVALKYQGGDLTDYGSIRQTVKSAHQRITRSGLRSGEVTTSSGSPYDTQRFEQSGSNMRMYEVFEWTRPFADSYAVMVGAASVPILKGGSMPIPFDYKEAPFIDVPYLRVPGEFEGYGLPLILENPQILLNTIKNQRIDAATLSIHKMWIVNPLANINREELVTRPFGIIYSIDPQGVREVQFSDIKSSAYKEEDMLKGDMRYASGVDDFSMGVGGGAASATEVRHLRESTLERVRLFVNHLGDAYAEVLRYWMDMTRQLFTKEMTIRIVGDNGEIEYPLIEKDDLMGMFDYRASVLPSIAGQMDIKKKQDMDLFQLLINLPFIDPRKLTAKVIQPWGWNLDNISQQEQAGPQGAMTPEMMMGGQEGGMPPGAPAGAPSPEAALGGASMPQMSQIPSSVLSGALSMLRKPGEGVSPFAQAGAPIDLLASGGLPPTVKGAPTPTTNPRGLNRGGKVNTNVSRGGNTNPEAQLENRVSNIQR